MPLPKTATIAARATEVYCEVWSVILQQFCHVAPIRTNDLKELSQLLPYLRQLLTCCACAGLLDNAMVSLACGHCYCFDCQFRDPLLKIHCRQCRGRTGLVSEKQLQLVVNCYKSMCQILGEELRKDPLAFSSAVKSEPNNPENVLHLKKETHSLLSENKASKEGEQVDLKMPVKISVVDNGSTFDPIAEIVSEVEKGTKVSRAIFVIRPPSKYANAKVSLAAPKKEPVSNTCATSIQTARINSVSTSQEGVDCSSVKCCLNAISNNGVKEVKNRNSGSARVVRKRRLHRKIRRTTTTKATVTSISAQPNMATHTNMSIQKLYSYQGHSNAKKRKKKVLTVASATPLLSTDVGDSEMKVSGSVVEIDMNSESLQNHTIAHTSSHKAELYRKGNHCQVRVEDLSVCVSCLDKRYLDLTPDTISLLPQEQLLYKLKEALATAPSDRESVRSSFIPGQWKKETRKRVWDPFCRSVTVKRRGEDIAEMILLQTSTAKVKRKVRQKLKPAASEGNVQHRPLTIPSPPLPIPPIPLRPVTNDIPIPEHISILSGDGRNNVTDVDINWTELSNFFESTDDEAIPTLSTLGCFSSPHHYQAPPPPSLDSELGSVHYGEFDRAMMQPQHRPCMPPLPPLPRPSHLPLPHHSPHPPMMPYSPMMGPENYYSPMNPGGIRPDLGGYSSPVTPMGTFPRGPCPEALYHQRSPNHHHPGGIRFPFPNSGGALTPVGRGGFPSHLPPTLMMVPKKKNNPMSDMVGKMKLKSPCTTPKNLLTTPAAQNKKQRRSPGYSEAGWRCRCGTNNVMFPEKVCAKGKCPCYSKGIACKNCLCRYCHNPFGPREQNGATSPVATSPVVVAEGSNQ